MKKPVIVLSLGGSLIIPNDVDVKFLREFKKVIKVNTKKFKFVIVCGGGSTARKYISALREENPKNKSQSMLGIYSTRLNSRLVYYFLNNPEKTAIVTSMSEMKKGLKSKDVVFWEETDFDPEQTSDTTSAEIAAQLETSFVNLTNVKGLYDKNPKKYKNAKFIPSISWNDFHKMATKQLFKPGQHFVLDQKASEIIMKKKISTFILGKDMKNLNNLLNGMNFKGTRIEG